MSQLQQSQQQQTHNSEDTRVWLQQCEAAAATLQTTIASNKRISREVRSMTTNTIGMQISYLKAIVAGVYE